MNKRIEELKKEIKDSKTYLEYAIEKKEDIELELSDVLEKIEDKRAYLGKVSNELRLKESEYTHLSKKDNLLELLNKMNARYMGCGGWSVTLTNTETLEREFWHIYSEEDRVIGGRTLWCYINDDESKIAGIPVSFATLLMSRDY